MRYLLSLLLLVVMVIFPATANASPDNTTRQQVWVDPRIPEYYVAQTQIAGDLDPGDGITVWVYESGPMQVVPNTTHIIALDYELFIYCNRDWPDQKTGVKIVESTEKEFAYQPSNIPRILKVISLIHAWQKDHPR